eukprot:261451_1
MQCSYPIQTDSCSLWLSNRDLLDTISEVDYRAKETEIIQLFGGTQNILKIILQNKTNLSHLQLANLYHILEQENDSDNNCDIEDSNDYPNKEHSPMSFSDLNEDCLAHIYKFLDEEEKQMLSQTARYFHIVSHSKKCLQFPMQSTSITYRLYQFINTLCTVPSDEPLFITTCGELCTWIKEICDVADIYRSVLKKRQK